MSPNDDIIYEYPSVYDEYKDEDWYLWFGSHDYSYDEEIDEEDYVPIRKIPKNPFMFVQVCAVAGKQAARIRSPLDRSGFWICDPRLISARSDRWDFRLEFSTRRYGFPKLLQFVFDSEKHDGNLRYTLYGVLVHAGGNTHSGQYYCYVRTSSGNWYLLDDDEVTRVKDWMVFEDKAYMLFYFRNSKNVPAKKVVGVVHQKETAVNNMGINTSCPIVSKEKMVEYIGGFKTIKVRGRVIIKKGNLMQWIQIWMQRVQGTREANSRTSFFKWGRMMRNVEAPMTL